MQPYLTNQLMTARKMRQFTTPSRDWEARSNQTRTGFVMFSSDTKYPEWDKTTQSFHVWNALCLKIDRKSRAEAKALIQEHVLPLYQSAHAAFCLARAKDWEEAIARSPDSFMAKTWLARADRMRALRERKCTVEWDGNHDAFVVRVPRGALPLNIDPLHVQVRGSKV